MKTEKQQKHIEKCEHCQKPLKEDQIIWLELDMISGEYKENIKSENSQGAFPFGKSCAKNIIKNKKHERI